MTPAMTLTPATSLASLCALLLFISGLVQEAVGRQAAESKNMSLVGHHNLKGRSAYQPVIQEQNGRWLAYIRHSAVA
jgi:hypothetical protein